jgi:hypothetical protein
MATDTCTYVVAGAVFVALRSFLDPAITPCSGRVSAGRSGRVAPHLDAKATSSGDRDLLTAVKSINGTRDQLRLDFTIRKLAYGDSK